MKPIIHLGIDPDAYPEGAVAEISAAAPDYEVLVTRDRKEIEAQLDRIEIALGSFPHDLIPQAPALAWLQQAGAGADWLQNHPEVQDLSFTLTSASGVHAIPISEHMLGFLLALGRGFPASVRGQKERIWEGNRNQDLFELAGKRVLLLGVGAIGERFAKLCVACDMEVIGLRRDPSLPADGVSRMVGMDALRDELPGTDILANTLPLTDETRGMIGRAEIDLMNDRSVIINIGRGATIDEAAMIDALKSGKLRAA
ncbi:MAG TPA: NAD(P)-dependent oxidoreductase, partial [Spirochaetia bacterium]|nr:NAD(P)-dependent oxidoreductase [Spirochaetia bacterium]